MTKLEKVTVVSQKPVVWHLRKCVATLPTTQFRGQNRPPPLKKRGLIKTSLKQTNFLQKGRLKTGRQDSLVMCHGLTEITNHWLPFGEPLATLQTGFHHLGSNMYEDSINHGTKRNIYRRKVKLFFSLIHTDKIQYVLQSFCLGKGIRRTKNGLSSGLFYAFCEDDKVNFLLNSVCSLIYHIKKTFKNIFQGVRMKLN
jgi:hypothetical protein